MEIVISKRGKYMRAKNLIPVEYLRLGNRCFFCINSVQTRQKCSLNLNDIAHINLEN